MYPDHHLFGLADAGTADQPPPPVPAADGHWVSAADSAVLIRTAQDGATVTVRLQAMDGPPGEPEPDAEAVSHTVQLDLPTGQISVNQIAAGWMHDVFALPAPGSYRLRITAWSRTRTADAYNRLFTTHNPADPAFENARQALDGQETYLVQLWRASEA
ncbi:hypothetical protein [Nonomuraea sp. NPDC049400]|uniref:hypothetical protein n=1 Tax=Nonomuraea sp. NPDC049400 TaxID=3364352 RepID=UPI0037AF0A98